MSRNTHLAVASTVSVALMLITSCAFGKCSPGGAGDQLADRYILKGDVVIDSSTKLVWARCSVGQRWSESTSHCVGAPQKATYDVAVNAAQPAGWRIPSPDELRTIVADGCENPAIDSTIFPDTAPDPYWAVDEEGCWIVNFGPGAVYGPNSYLCGYGNVSAMRLIRVR